MINISIEDAELAEVVKAYNTITNFLGKVIPKEQIYLPEFLIDIESSIADINANEFVSVDDLDSSLDD